MALHDPALRSLYDLKVQDVILVYTIMILSKGCARSLCNATRT